MLRLSFYGSESDEGKTSPMTFPRTQVYQHRLHPSQLPNTPHMEEVSVAGFLHTHMAAVEARKVSGVRARFSEPVSGANGFDP